MTQFQKRVRAMLPAAIFEIADQLGYGNRGKGAVKQALDAMERKGLVSRPDDPDIYWTGKWKATRAQ